MKKFNQSCLKPVNVNVYQLFDEKMQCSLYALYTLIIFLLSRKLVDYFRSSCVRPVFIPETETESLLIS